jgi:hypothetical protein
VSIEKGKTYKKNGKINFDGFKTLIDFQATNGTRAVLIMGSTGEVSTLSIEERQEIISIFYPGRTDPTGYITSLFIRKHIVKWIT